MQPLPNAIHWPAEFSPSRAPIHVRNELLMASSPLGVWSWLIRARAWPSWYSNSQAVRIESNADTLSLGATFRWRTFGVRLVSQVVEFVPAERIAWNARGLGVWAYHAWLLRTEGSG